MLGLLGPAAALAMSACEQITTYRRRAPTAWALPMALRLLLATRPMVLSAVLGVVYRRIQGHLRSEARLTRRRWARADHRRRGRTIDRVIPCTCLAWPRRGFH